MKISSLAMPDAINHTRGETRFPTVVILRLTSGSGEVIPAVMLDLSASGLQALVDVRFSPLLPPPQGSRFEVEFFLEEIEVRQATLEVIRVEEWSPYLVTLGCQFTETLPQLPLSIRAKVASSLVNSHRRKASVTLDS